MHHYTLGRDDFALFEDTTNNHCTDRRKIFERKTCSVILLSYPHRATHINRILLQRWTYVRFLINQQDANAQLHQRIFSPVAYHSSICSWQKSSGTEIWYNIIICQSPFPQSDAEWSEIDGIMVIELLLNVTGERSRWPNSVMCMRRPIAWLNYLRWSKFGTNFYFIIMVSPVYSNSVQLLIGLVDDVRMTVANTEQLVRSYMTCSCLHVPCS